MTAAIKIAVVGGPNSGKSSLLDRFVRDEFLMRTSSLNCSACELFDANRLRGFSSAIKESDTGSDLPDLLVQCYKKKTRCTCRRQRSVIRTVAYRSLNGRTRFVDLLLMDVPALTPFPQDTQQEFDEEGARGVTKASAYIILFDVTKMESHGFMCRVRLEIQDFLRNSTTEAVTPIGRKGAEEDELNSASCGTSLKRSFRRNKDTYPATEQAVSPVIPSSTGFDINSKSAEPVIVIVGTKIDLRSNDKNVAIWYKEAVNTIRKSWKHPYVVCSAKRGYQVEEVFSTAVNAVLVARGLRKKPKAKNR